MSKNAVRIRPACVPSAIAFATPKITLTFGMPIVLAGIPNVVTNTGKVPTAARLTSPTTVELTYDTPGAVTDVTFQSQDPALRNTVGGYLPEGTFPTTP